MGQIEESLDQCSIRARQKFQNQTYVALPTLSMYHEVMGLMPLSEQCVTLVAFS